MQQLFRVLIASTVLCLLPIAVVAQTTVVYLVRHAEKIDDSRDPDLSTLGKARAETIANIFADEDISNVFSSPYIRTRKTAEPTAIRQGVVIQEYDPDKPEQFVAKLKTSSGTVLVTGHSNTIPQLVNLLTGENLPDLDDRVYDKIYRITLVDGLSKELSITYSEPRTPIDAVLNTQMNQR